MPLKEKGSMFVFNLQKRKEERKEESKEETDYLFLSRKQSSQAIFVWLFFLVNPCRSLP